MTQHIHKMERLAHGAWSFFSGSLLNAHAPWWGHTPQSFELAALRAEAYLIGVKDAVSPRYRADFRFLLDVLNVLRVENAKRSPDATVYCGDLRRGRLKIYFKPSHQESARAH